MTRAESFDLVPLDCPTCGAAVHALGEDVVYYCTACQNGYTFSVESRGLEPVEVGFVSLPNVAVDEYLPFWVLPATITIHQRKGSSLNLSGILGFFTGDGGKPSVGPGEGSFVVPAFDCKLDALTALTKAHTLQVPNPDERLGERLLGGRHGIDDARKLAHYALIASEVEKNDLLKRLEYKIEFGEPRLLGVPFQRDGRGLRDAQFGIRI